MILSLTPPTKRLFSGGDQARRLRDLAARQSLAGTTDQLVKPPCHSIVISGGKGGVGRSVIALNLAIALTEQGGLVGLVDASPDLGSVELLCGINGYWNLSHVMQGSRQLDDVLLPGPAGVTILTGASCLTDRTLMPTVSQELHERLCDFERRLDWLVVDASGGATSLTRDFALSADDLLVVTTPEPTAVAEAYSYIKSLASQFSRPRLGLLVNQADSLSQAQPVLDRLLHSARSFLNIDLHRRGSIPRDPAIPVSVIDRMPFVVKAPESLAGIEIRKLAQRWTRVKPRGIETTFFERLLNVDQNSQRELNTELESNP